MADIYVSTSGSDSTGTGASGSPYATPGKAANVMSGGDRIAIQLGLYTQTSSSTNVAGGIPVLPLGTWNAPSQIVGFQTTIGDLDDVDVNDSSNAPVIKSFASGGTTVFQFGGNFCQARNLVVDGASHANTGFYSGGQYCYARNCKALNCLIAGFSPSNYNSFFRCLALGASNAFQIASSIGVLLDTCVAGGGFSSAGFYLLSAGCSLLSCLAIKGGASADGVQTQYGTFIDRFVSYSNGRDGIRITSQAQAMALRNAILFGNGGYGLNQTGATATTTFEGNYNAFGSNSSGNRNNVQAGSHDVSLSADPFVNGAATINTVADALAAFALSTGGLTALKGQGIPAYLDIGAVQHQDAGGAAAGARLVGASALVG